MTTRPEVEMRKALVAIVLVFGAGLAAAVASEAMTAPAPSWRAVPPVAPTPTVAPPGGRTRVPAPIDGLDIRIVESAPPRYFADVTAGLPSGCAQRDSHTVSRTGDVLTIAVLNSMPPGDTVCTMIYGTYKLSIELTGTFARGTAYTVRVNDRTTSFVAQ